MTDTVVTKEVVGYALRSNGTGHFVRSVVGDEGRYCDGYADSFQFSTEGEARGFCEYGESVVEVERRTYSNSSLHFYLK